MSRNRKPREATKAANKGRAVSMLVHSLLLLMAFLPFLSMQSPTEPTKEALVIQFDFPYNNYVAAEKFVAPKQEMGSQMAGSEAGGSTSSRDPIQPRPVEAAPSRLSAPALTSVTKSTSAITSNVSDIPLPTPKITTQSAWQPVTESGGVESDGVEELKILDWSSGTKGAVAGSGDGDDDSDIWNDGFGSGTGGSGSGSGGGPGNETGKGSGPGGGTGQGGLGKGSGITGVGKGLSWGVALGEGDLSRSLIQRSPKAGALAVKEGKICIYMCVDKAGRVISSQYNLSKSTIKDISLLTKAQETAKEYVFAPDIMGHEKECGNFYFVFKFD